MKLAALVGIVVVLGGCREFEPVEAPVAPLPPPPPVAPQAPQPAPPTFSATIGGRPFVPRMAILAYRNHQLTEHRSDFPNQEFTITRSTVFVFERDIDCNAFPRISFSPRDAMNGETYLQFDIQSVYPFRPEQLELARNGPTPMDDMVEGSISTGGSIHAHGLLGTVQLLSANDMGGWLGIDARTQYETGPESASIHGPLLFRACPESAPTPPRPPAPTPPRPPAPTPPPPPARPWLTPF